MNFSLSPKRTLLRHLVLGFLALGVGISHAADPYPTKSVTIINPWAPGGPSDAIIRPIAQQLAQRLGQAVVVENRGVQPAPLALRQWPGQRLTGIHCSLPM